MRILIIGSDRKVFDEISAVAKRQIAYSGTSDNLDIIVFSLASLQLRETKLSDRVTVYPSSSFSRFLYIFDAIRTARKLQKPDLISAQDPFESGLAGYFVAKYFGVPLHIQIHTDLMSPYFYRDTILNKIRFYISKFIIPRAKSIRVVSQRIKNSLLLAYPKIPEFSIQILPIHVDRDKIKDSPIDVDLHKKYPQFKKIILMASRLTREKNIGLAIDAMQAIVKKFPNAGLIIVGEGPMKKGLAVSVQGLGLEKNVILEDWSDSLSSYYKTTDLFLLTSNYDGYAMTVVESLVAGTPVIMTDVGCASEVVIDGQNGLVFSVGNLNKLIEAISKFLSDPSLSSNLKSGAQKMIWQDSEDVYLKQYRKGWEVALG